MQKVSILGCGRWASFHAWYQSVKLHHEVMVYGRVDDPLFATLQSTGQNGYLSLPQQVTYTTDLSTALAFADTQIIAIAAQGMQDFAREIGRQQPRQKNFVLCMKGLDQVTGERLSQIVRKNVDESNHICVWVGPGHVEELTAGEPNVMIMAGDDPKTVEQLITAFESPLISILYSNDLIGVEVGAAAKNVMGIAAGLLDGLGKSSLKGALMARGCYEVSQLIDKMGGDKLTAFGMSHLGDFEATLFSQNSHNRRYGEELAGDNLSSDLGTAEGVATAKAIYFLAQDLGVVMPITNTIYSILYQNADKRAVIDGLLLKVSHKEFAYE